MELNIEKINTELKRIGKSKYWLAKQLELPIQNIMYWINSKSLRGAEPIGKVLQINPRDLIK